MGEEGGRRGAGGRWGGVEEVQVPPPPGALAWTGACGQRRSGRGSSPPGHWDHSPLSWYVMALSWCRWQSMATFHCHHITAGHEKGFTEDSLEIHWLCLAGAWVEV